jgi:hypothetical protein
MRTTLTRWMLAAGICLSSGAQAALITIDGNLADWGLKQTGQDSDWIPDARVVPDARQYTVEDQTGGAGTRLFPGWGGQNYDAEAIYVSLDSSFLYIALITGLSPDTPDNPAANSYGPGDFAIDFGQDGSFEFGVQTTGDDFGKVYRVTAWDYGLWDVTGNHRPTNPDKRHPTSIKTGTEVGIGQLVYTKTPFTNMGVNTDDKHYVIEAAIPLTSFTGYSGKFDVHWTMNCANDAIHADPYLPVAEPGTLALMPLGLLGMMALRRRKTV